MVCKVMCKMARVLTFPEVKHPVILKDMLCFKQT